jgi:hypothetical protein
VTELLRVAYENVSLYQLLTWMNPLQIGGRMRMGNDIELWATENVGMLCTCHLELGRDVLCAHLRRSQEEYHLHL